jgi:hypothetical protein
MKRRRRLEITIQRHEITTLRPAEMPLRGRCLICERDVTMLPVSLAARSAGVSPRTIYRWVEENRVHYRESSDGTVLICENSFTRK